MDTKVANPNVNILIKIGILKDIAARNPPKNEPTAMPSILYENAFPSIFL